MEFHDFVGAGNPACASKASVSAIKTILRSNPDCNARGKIKGRRIPTRLFQDLVERHLMRHSALALIAVKSGRLWILPLVEIARFRRPESNRLILPPGKLSSRFDSPSEPRACQDTLMYCFRFIARLCQIAQGALSLAAFALVGNHFSLKDHDANFFECMNVREWISV